MGWSTDSFKMPSIPIPCKNLAFDEDVGNFDHFSFCCSCFLCLSCYCFQYFRCRCYCFCHYCYCCFIFLARPCWPLEVFKVALKAKIGLQIRQGLVISLLETSKAVKFKNCIRITRRARSGPSCLSFCWADKVGHFLEK